MYNFLNSHFTRHQIMIEKNNEFHVFFKYQICLIKNKFNKFDKNNHHNVSTFQQIEFFDHKKTL